MLAKKNRLSREAFNRFFAMGKRHHTPSLQIIYSRETSFHASVVVSKKVAKHAVLRNKIRRRIYDILRHYSKEMGTVGVFIILTKQGVEKMAYETLKQEIHTALKHIIK